MNRRTFPAAVRGRSHVAALVVSLALLTSCGGGAVGVDPATPSAAGVYGMQSALAARAVGNETVNADASAGVRYVRLEATSEVNGNPWSSMAEFNLLDASGVLIPRNGWAVSVDSAEMAGENGAAERAIDGDPNTFWHTAWSAANPLPPHTFTVDLGAVRTIGGFKYLPRVGAGNGTIAGWRFSTSVDGSTWTLAAQGTFASSAEEKTVIVGNPIAPAPSGTTQYVRLEALSEVNGQPWASMAEFNLLDANGAVIPRAEWRVSADSVEMVGENAAVERAIDGDPNTFWHTQWQGASPPGPHAFTVNLGTARAVSGFKYLPRPGGGNGSIAGWRFYTSADGATWALAGEGSFAGGGDEKTVLLAAELAPAPAPAPLPTGPSGQNPPIVLNATTSAGAGDVVSLQGENFGTAPSVSLSSAPNVPLGIVNRVGTGWLAVQIPANAQGALILRVANGTGTSAPVKVNAAWPLHLDTLRLVPGGAFRVFGRNLRVAGATPRIMVDGVAAALDLSRSDEHMLTAVAPTSLKVTKAAAVLVDNGNGSGAAALDRTIEVAADGAGDPFGLGVGWGAAFSAVSNRTIDAATDARLASKVVCNGSANDSPAIQAAIELAAATGGGVVRLPAGNCRLGAGLALRSRVVVQGAGKAATELVYAANYPVLGVNLDLAGIANLTLTNAGGAGEGPLLKDSTRVFIKNLRVRLMTSRQMYLTGNRQFVVANSDFEQGGSISHQGPYTFANSAGLVFENNTTSWVDGAPTFTRLRESVVRSNRFTRDSRTQNAEGVVHSLVIDFSHRIAVVGNTFDVTGGPITNLARNDGETILTEGGGARRTENLGAVASAGLRTLTDPANTLQTDPFDEGAIPENYGVAIVGGRGAGQTRRVVAYTRPTLTVDRDWEVVPDASSRYATFVWGLEKSLIKDNKLAQNPRGIWLYHTAVRDVDVIGNAMSEGGGIYLRSYQNLATKSFMPIYNVLIARNSVVNTLRQWGSYVSSVFVNSDARAFGIATIGVEMRANQVTTNAPNLSNPLEEYAGTEGFLNMMRVENYDGYESSATPRLLGSILVGNGCTNCAIGVRIGTGAGGSTILNTRLINSGAALEDSAATANRSEKSTDTVLR